jgi:hypothetical protein
MKLSKDGISRTATRPLLIAKLKENGWKEVKTPIKKAKGGA